MKSKFPTNKEVLKIERQRALKNHHYTMRFICVLLMMVYLAIWFSYKSQPQAVDYEVWFKIAIVTAMLVIIHFCCWFFGFLRHWLSGGVLGIVLSLPYVLLLFALPKKAPVKYQVLEEVAPKALIDEKPQQLVVKTQLELLTETITSIKAQYQQQTHFLLLENMQANQSTQVREYFDSLQLSDLRVEWTTTPQGDVFIFQNIQVSFDVIMELTKSFSKSVQIIEELDLIQAIYSENKFSPRLFNDRIVSSDSENEHQVKTAAGWFNTLHGHKPLYMESTLLNLKNTDNRAYNADIEDKLASLLFETYLMVPRELVFEAYINWVKEINADRQAILTRYYYQQQELGLVDDLLLEFIFDYLPEETLPLVETRWMNDPRSWEFLLQKQPAIVEPRLLEIYHNLNLNQKKSALKILGKIGTAKSSAFIKQRLEISNIEERIFLKSTSSTIKTRLAN